MKITVMGPGGVGGYFGARLAAAGNDVTFVARGAHLAGHADARACASTARSASCISSRSRRWPMRARSPAADAIIFAVKMRDTETRGREPARPGGQGRRRSSRSRTAWRAPSASARSSGATTWCRAWRASRRTSSEPGVIKQIGKFAQLEFGEARRQAERAHDRVPRRPARQAGIDATLSPNIGRELWMKFAMLAPLAGHDGADARAARADPRQSADRARC